MILKNTKVDSDKNCNPPPSFKLINNFFFPKKINSKMLFFKIYSSFNTRYTKNYTVSLCFDFLVIILKF